MKPVYDESGLACIIASQKQNPTEYDWGTSRSLSRGERRPVIRETTVHSSSDDVFVEIVFSDSSGTGGVNLSKPVMTVCDVAARSNSKPLLLE